MKLHPQSILRVLTDTFPNAGRIEWIGVRPKAREPVVMVHAVQAIADRGLAGDHRSTARRGSRRQVTLIQQEHLAAVASLLRRDAIDAALVRRNFVISGVNLLALKDRRFSIGEVV